MSKTILPLATFVLLFGSSAVAQTPLSVSIEQLFEMADEHNADIRAQQQAVDVAGQQVKVARAGRLPQINASLSLSYLGDGTILDRDFSNVTRDRLPHFSNNLGVELYQPVYTGGAISGGIAAAETGVAIAGTGLDASRNGVRMAIVENFLRLAKSRNLLQVYDENISLTEKLLGEMQAKCEQGIVLKNDITRYELRLSTLRYDRLEIANSIDVCNANLRSLTGLGDDVDVVPAGADDVAGSVGAEADWIQSAGANAPQLRMYDHQMSAERTARQITHADYLPKVGIIAGDSFQGPITFEVPAINKNYNAWFVGVNVKWNISSLFTTAKYTRRHDMEIGRLQEAKVSESESVTRKIHEAYTLYNQAIERLEIEKKNVRLADENYTVVSNRFDNQLALLTDMLDASNARLDAGVRLVNAAISAQFYYYQLHYLAGTLISL